MLRITNLTLILDYMTSKRFQNIMLIVMIMVLATLVTEVVYDYCSYKFGAGNVFLIATMLVYFVGVYLALKKVVDAHKKDIHWMKVYAYSYLLLLMFVGGGFIFVAYIS